MRFCIVIWVWTKSGHNSNIVIFDGERERIHIYKFGKKENPYCHALYIILRSKLRFIDLHILIFFSIMTKQYLDVQGIWNMIYWIKSLTRYNHNLVWFSTASPFYEIGMVMESILVKILLEVLCPIYRSLTARIQGSIGHSFL